MTLTTARRSRLGTLLSTLSAALFLGWVIPALSYPEYRQAQDNLGHDHAECLAFFSVIRRCLENSDQNELAAKYDEAAERLTEQAVRFTLAAGLKTETLLTRLQLSRKAMNQAIGNNCGNISILIAKHSDLCAGLVHNPDRRAQELIDAELERAGGCRLK